MVSSVLLRCSAEDGPQPLLDAGFVDGGRPSSDSIVSIRVGGIRACVLYADGRLRCWGRAEEREPVDDGLRYRYFSILGDRFCGLTRTDELVCFPKDRLAEVEAVDVPGIRQVELSEAGRVCTLRVDGSVECFEPAEEGLREFVDIPDKAFDSLSVDLSFACGLVDGSGSAECFGISDPPFPILVGPAPPSIGRLSAVEAGRLAHCAIGLDGQLSCWGSDIW